jgi:hypothetical protein
MDLEARNIRIRALRETLRQRHSVLMSSPNVTLLMSRRDLSRPRILAPAALPQKKPGASPQELKPPRKQALKARFGATNP